MPIVATDPKSSEFTGDVIARFTSKIDKNGPVFSRFGRCWLWTDVPSASGYGRFRIGKRIYQAHRIAYLLAGHRIPRGRDIDHLCSRRICVRPSHLEPVSRRINLLRGRTLAATHAKKTHCVNGHRFTKANTNLWRGTRICRACHRDNERNRRHRLKAA